MATPTPPQDIVAIFHASFHPTKGNTLDWSLTANNDIDLEGLEFSALPSGLHLVERDVIYFTTSTHAGVCIFRRRPTPTLGQRGFLLSSLGVLCAPSPRPRPWRHLPAMGALVDAMDKEEELERDSSADRWEHARDFFEATRVRDGREGEPWKGWAGELDEPESPTLHLPHLLRLLGPTSLTLYKHILGRRRVLIYTAPPVQPACLLCYVAADVCWEAQCQCQSYDSPTTPSTSTSTSRLKPHTKYPTRALGMVTLSDMDRLKALDGGWVACTTDALFLEKPAYYDLLIDLTTVSNGKGSRPAFYASKPVEQGQSRRGETHRLSAVRFAWSDVRLWTELDRILNLSCPSHSHSHSLPSTSTTPPLTCASCNCGPSSSYPYTTAKSRLTAAWTDAWRVYEDVCLVCAGLWIGLGWRPAGPTANTNSNSGAGGVRLEGSDDISLSLPSGVGKAYVRSLGMGIEGRPTGRRRESAMSWSGGSGVGRAGEFGVSGEDVDGEPGQGQGGRGGEGDGEDEREGEEEKRERHVRTTLALLQTLHAHTAFTLSILESFVPPPPSEQGVGTTTRTAITYLSPKDVLAFELGPLSALDARFLEWLWEEYAPPSAGGVVVRRGWREVLGVVVGWT